MIAMATAVVCLCLAVSQVGGSHIPMELNGTINHLLQYYKSITGSTAADSTQKLSGKSPFRGKLVFSRELPFGHQEAKMVYMGGILETYEELIGQMLKQLPTMSLQTEGSNGRPGSSAVTANPDITKDAETEAQTTVRKELNYILQRVQKLRKSYYQEQDKLLLGLKALQLIQTEDVAIQREALWELPWLFEEASSLSSKMRDRRRRRRQAQRVKTYLRG